MKKSKNHRKEKQKQKTKRNILINKELRETFSQSCINSKIANSNDLISYVNFEVCKKTKSFCMTKRLIFSIS